MDRTMSASRSGLKSQWSHLSGNFLIGDRSTTGVFETSSAERGMSIRGERSATEDRSQKKASSFIPFDAEMLETGVSATFNAVSGQSRMGVESVTSVVCRFRLFNGIPVTEAKSTAKPLEGTARRSLLKAKDDYQETLEVVTKTLTEDLPMFNGKLAEFYEAVSDAEELGVTRIASLGKKIKADRWLLSTEREELLRAVAVEEERFLDRLRKRVEEVESDAKGDE